MSQTNDSFNPFDPTGMLKHIRDANLDAWSKMMIDLVQTETYAKATAVMLDAWLSNSAPFRKMVESALIQALTNLSLPVRGDITSLAERLTNLEMRLDDMDAKLDELLRASKPRAGRTKASNGEGHS